jgi:thiol-disulfide isomerase/thioredoxin
MKRYLMLVAFFFIGFFARSQTVISCTLTELENTISSNDSEMLVVNFWAAYCKPCLAEIPNLIRVCKEKKNVKLVLVSLDDKSMFPKKLNRFVQKHRFNTNLFWLNESDANYFCPKIDPSWDGTIPATLFINKKNRKRIFIESEMSGLEIEEMLVRLLDARY